MSDMKFISYAENNITHFIVVKHFSLKILLEEYFDMFYFCLEQAPTDICLNTRHNASIELYALSKEDGYGTNR